MGMSVWGVLLSEGASVTQTGLCRGTSGLVPGLAVCAGGLGGPWGKKPRSWQGLVSGTADAGL